MVRGNTQTTILDPQLKRVANQLRCDADGLTRRGVLGGIIQEIGDNTLDLRRIRPDGWQVVRQLDVEHVVAE